MAFLQCGWLDDRCPAHWYLKFHFQTSCHWSCTWLVFNFQIFCHRSCTWQVLNISESLATGIALVRFFFCHKAEYPSKPTCKGPSSTSPQLSAGRWPVRSRFRRVSSRDSRDSGSRRRSSTRDSRDSGSGGRRFRFGSLNLAPLSSADGDSP